MILSDSITLFCSEYGISLTSHVSKLPGTESSAVRTMLSEVNLTVNNGRMNIVPRGRQRQIIITVHTLKRQFAVNLVPNSLEIRKVKRITDDIVNEVTAKVKNNPVILKAPVSPFLIRYVFFPGVQLFH